jgi:general secretion pathway protein K
MNTRQNSVQARRHRGAALLMAMLTVTLVATLTSAAQWQQWQQVNIEVSERNRRQIHWLMTGALDWSRLILREDAFAVQNNGVDHLGEPWALPIQESKLSTFLSQDQQWREGDAEVYLSGKITDAQSRMNVMNLIEKNSVSSQSLNHFAALFDRLQLPQHELHTLSTELLASFQANAKVSTHLIVNRSNTTLMPQHTEQLVWLGLSPTTLDALKDHITLLPEATPVNLNTASAEVLSAVLPGLKLAAARQAIEKRQRGHWHSLQAASQAFGALSAPLNEQSHSVQSRYFEVQGRIRIDNIAQEERILVHRSGNQVNTLWRINNSPKFLKTLPR